MKKIWSVIAILIFGAVFSPAQAATFTIPSSQGTIDCAAMGIQGGDTIILESGTRGNLRVQNCIGSPDNYIRLTNDPSGQTIINATGDGYVGLWCKNCEYFMLDGSNGGQQYGIKIQYGGSGDPTSYMPFTGSSSDFTIRNIEIEGGMQQTGAEIGISVNDSTYLQADHPGEWRENILIENNYVHDMGTECLYVGPNWGGGSTGADNLRLRDIEIRNNTVENCGWDGIELKSSIEGTNLIHGNTVSNVGLRSDPPSTGNGSYGISVFEGYADIYNNTIDTNYNNKSCINQGTLYLPESYGPLGGSIHDNTISNCSGQAIGTFSADGAAEVAPDIYNNIVDGENLGGTAPLGDGSGDTSGDGTTSGTLDCGDPPIKGCGEEACLVEDHFFESSCDKQERMDLINEIYWYITEEEQKELLNDMDTMLAYESSCEPILTVDENGQHYFLGKPVTMAISGSSTDSGTPAVSGDIP